MDKEQALARKTWQSIGQGKLTRIKRLQSTKKSGVSQTEAIPRIFIFWQETIPLRYPLRTSRPNVHAGGSLAGKESFPAISTMDDREEDRDLAPLSSASDRL